MKSSNYPYPCELSFKIVPHQTENNVFLKKEFIGPGLHLRPVRADRLGRLSSGLSTLCLAPVGMTMEGEDPLRTGEP